MAVFVSNPRKYASNGAQDRMVAKASGLGLAAVKQMKKKNYAEYQRLLAKAGGSKALTSYRAKGKAVRKGAKAFVAKMLAKKGAGSRKGTRKGAKATSTPGSGFTGTKKGARGRTMYFLNGKLVKQAVYAARTGSAGSKRTSAARVHKGKGMMMAPAFGTAAEMRAAKKAAKAFYAKASKGKKGRKGKSRKAGAKVSGRKSLAGRARDSKGRLMKANPSSYIFNRGGRRRRNGLDARGFAQDAFGFVRSQFTVANGIGVAGALVALAAVSPYVEEQVGRVPVIGEYLAEMPFTVSALGVGALTTAGGYAIGQARAGLSIGTAAVVGGLFLDLFPRVADFVAGYLPGTNKAGIAYSGIAYSGIEVNPRQYAGVVVNPGYGAADEHDMMLEYGDAADGDAAHSGEDMDDDEGQALMDGPRAFFGRFGRPPRVASRIRAAYSRHAGKKGHRWGWMIKLVGPRKAAEIAALAPAQRQAVIADLRRCALSSLQAQMAASQQGSTSQIADGGYNISHEGAPGAAAGAGGYGSLVYAGAGY